MSQNKEQEKKSRKRVKQKGDKQSFRCRVQNTGYKELEEISEGLNSVKKFQSETKDTLPERTNNLQGNNSREDEAKNQINDLENKEAKHNPPEQKEKRIQERKMGIVQAASGKT